MATAVLHALKSQLPSLAIDLLGQPAVLSLFADDALVNERIVYGPQPARKKLSALLVAAQRIAARDYDASLILPNSFESALLIALAAVPLRVGYARDGRGFLLNVQVNQSVSKEHQIWYYLKLLPGLGLRVQWFEPKLVVRESKVVQMKQFLSRIGVGTRFAAALFPGAAYGPAKRWPVERFLELGSIVQNRYDGAIALLGSEADRPVCSLIQQQGGRGFLNFAGLFSVEQTMAFLAACPLCVANDSGGMHIAAALGVPTVGLFGPTDPEQTRPRGRAAAIVVGKADCRPCTERVCPRNHECMRAIAIEAVLSAIEELGNGKTTDRISWD